MSCRVSEFHRQAERELKCRAANVAVRLPVLQRVRVSRQDRITEMREGKFAREVVFPRLVRAWTEKKKAP